MDSISNFYDAMARSGFDPPPEIAPGRVVRFSANGKKSDRAGWVLLFPDEMGAVFGDWRSGEEHTWQAERERPQSEADRAAFRAMVETAKRQAVEAREREHAEAAARAAEIWAEAKPAPAEHGYLVTKGITPQGARISKDGKLLIPVYGPDGLMSLQFIAPSGEKRFLPGGKVKSGHTWVPNGNAPPRATERVFLAEGWATAKSVHAAMGAPVCVAFNAGNLADVAMMIRAQCPSARLIVAGDDDRTTEGNPGRTKATEAAAAVGAEAVFPTFPPGAAGSDFNDLCRVSGLDAVRAALGGDEPGIRLADWVACERFKGAPPPREWLVSGIFPAGKPALLAAAGGVGKSFLLLELSRAVAGGARHCPIGEVTKHGAAVLMCAEDDAIEVHSRLVSLGPIPPRLYVIPCPDAGGTPGLFGLDERGRGPVTTAAFHALARQIKRLRDVALVTFDPLQALCCGLDLNLPQHAQHVCSELATLATETGAAVLVSHHFRKSGPITSPEAARDAIRGTGGLVDGVRSVFALWPSEDTEAQKVCRVLGVGYDRGRVVRGAIVKSNGRADLGIRTFVRDECGILRDRRFELGELSPSRDDLTTRLKDAIAQAAARMEPFTKSGPQAGIYARRHELPGGFQDMGKHTLEAMAQDLLAGGGVIQCRMKKSEAPPGRWLDVPGGAVAKLSAGINRGAMDAAQHAREGAKFARGDTRGAGCEEDAGWQDASA